MSSFFRAMKKKSAVHPRRRFDDHADEGWRALQALESRCYMSAGPFEVGSSMALANSIGSVSEIHALSSSIGTPDEIDVFSIDVTAGQVFSFDIDGDGTLNSHLRIFDSTGRAITSNDNGRAPGEARSYDSFLTVKFRTTGTYYVGVSSAKNTRYNIATGLGAVVGNSTGAYELTVTNLTPTDTAGKTLLTARELDELSGESSVHEFVGRYDTLDYYHFTLGEDSNFELNLTDLTADADVRIIIDRNYDGRISKSEVIGVSRLGGTADENLTGELAAGEYYIEVRRYSGDTYYSLNLTAEAVEETVFIEEEDPEPTPEPEPEPEPSPVPTPDPDPTPVSDWFAQNLSDTGIIAKARSLFGDGSISRTDMMQILHEAGDDDGVVSSTELSDLRLMVTSQGASTLQLSADVRVLTNKVVNSHTANAKYQGAALGNLAAGSADAQLDKLINKWFLGLDRPNATIYGSTYQYRQAAGSLFVGGGALSDIEQGYVGDCYLLATLGSVAKLDPTAITNMFIDNGDGTFAVRFFQNGVADYVTVDLYLPTDSYGRFIFANMGNYASSSANELWVGLAEKAYAQLNEAGWIGQDGTNSYAGIEGGWMEGVYEQVLGRNASSTYMPSQNSLVGLFNTGKMVTLGSNSSTNSGVIGGHAYVLQNYNSATGTFDLYNPWGVQHVSLTYAQLSANFSWIATA